jgi:hypothetical protein
MPLGKFKFCDTCGEQFQSGPEDNDTCMDCVYNDPKPECQVCGKPLRRGTLLTKCYECATVILINSIPIDDPEENDD